MNVSGWLQIDDGDTIWELDSDLLRSTWKCIWDAGCAGIEREAAVDQQLGCCSVGAQMLDEDEAMLISALGGSLEDGRAQFGQEIADGGVLNSDRTNTRVVDGACIFLNRPGFAGGAGCALHAEAVDAGESPIDWKPAICWQLPLKVERTEDGERTRARLRAWRRSDWGPEGQEMAFCCTEPGAAYVAEQPVYITLRDELAALVGDEVSAEITRRLS